jgi:hypothetical protein
MPPGVGSRGFGILAADNDPNEALEAAGLADA